MTTKNFLASCAKATFALAAVVMMSAVLTSCSKDNDDAPMPEPKTNTVVVDGKEATIEKAQFKKNLRVLRFMPLRLPYPERHRKSWF